MALGLCFGLKKVKVDAPETTTNSSEYDEYVDRNFEVTLNGDYYTIDRAKVNDLTEVFIPAEYKGLPIKTISGKAFILHDEIESLKTSYVLDTFGSKAFFGCESLESVELGLFPTKFKKNVFFACPITNVYIDAGAIEEGLFCNYEEYGNQTIETIVLGERVTQVRNSAFSNFSELKSITIPNGVTHIEGRAFSNCEKLTEIEIPNSVVKLGSDAFWGCTGITTIVVPNGVQTIRDWTFSCCKNLVSVTIPSSVTNIGNNIFASCYKLETIEVDKDNPVYHSSGNCLIETATKTLIAGCKTSVIPTDGSVEKIANGAFQDCVGLTNIALPSCIVDIDSGAFYNCYNIESIVVEEGNARYKSTGNCLVDTQTKTLLFGGDNAVIPTDGSVEYIYYDAFLGRKGLTTITIPSSVKQIGSSAFRGCSNLESISFSEGLTDIGEFAFEGCTSLTSIELPNSVIDMDGVFKNCSNLESVVLPQNIHRLYGTFVGCSSLQSISIPKTIWQITEAFDGCSSLESIVVEEGCQNFYSINNCVVRRDSKEIIALCKTSVIPTDGSVVGIDRHVSGYVPHLVIPSCMISNLDLYLLGGLESIEVQEGNPRYHSSGNCLIETATKTLIKGCKNSVIPTDGSVQIIDYGAFRGCDITLMEIPDCVTEIRTNAFYGCKNLVSVKLPKNLTQVGYAAFDHCSSLTSITIPSSISVIESYAFQYCDLLTSITFEKGIDWENFEIGYVMFGYNSVTAITFNVYVSSEQEAKIAKNKLLELYGKKIINTIVEE